MNETNETPVETTACFTYVDANGKAEHFTLARVHAHVLQLASELEPLLTDERSVAVVDLPNCPLFVWTLLACAHLGKPLVALNHRLSASEKRLRIEQLTPHVRVGTTIDKSWAAQAESFSASEEAEADETENRPSSKTPTNAVEGRREWEAKSDPLPAGVDIPDFSNWKPLDELRIPDPDCLAVVMFTSGTSGIPKAAELTWGQLLASAEVANQSLNCHSGALWQAALPLYHIGGLQVVIRSFLASTPFVLYQRWDAVRVLEDAQLFGATHISVVDKMLQDLLTANDQRQQNALGSYQCLLLGGAALNEQTLMKARRANARVFASFGMTETCSQIANCLVDESFDGSLHLLQGNEARILDSDDQGRGILAVRGPSVITGYLNTSMPLTEDGFFITGDTARLDGEKLIVYERADDLFISGGENVYPAEVERCIKQVPGITDCYVFGVPDNMWGMRPVALVETTLDPDHAETLVRDHVREHLAGFSQPDRIVAVAEIPRSGIGKIDRPAARALVL